MNRIQKYGIVALGVVAMLASCDKVDYDRDGKVQIPEKRALMMDFLRQDFAEVEEACMEEYVVIEPHTRLSLLPGTEERIEHHQFSMPHYYPVGIPRIDFMMHVAAIQPEGEVPTVDLVQLSRVHESTTEFGVIDLYSVPKMLKDMLGPEALEVEFSMKLWFEGEDLSQDPYMPIDPDGADITKGFNFNTMTICRGSKDYHSLVKALKTMMATMYFRGGPKHVVKAEIFFDAQCRVDGLALDTPIPVGEEVPINRVYFQQLFLRDGVQEGASGYQRTKLVATVNDQIGE